MTLYGLELPADLCGNGECDCAETVIRGKRISPPPGHDCEYVRQRNTLIGQAERIATKEVATISPRKDGGVSHAAWTKVFSETMDRLSAPLLNGQ